MPGMRPNMPGLGVQAQQPKVTTFFLLFHFWLVRRIVQIQQKPTKTNRIVSFETYGTKFD